MLNVTCTKMNDTYNTVRSKSFNAESDALMSTTLADRVDV